MSEASSELPTPAAAPEPKRPVRLTREPIAPTPSRFDDFGFSRRFDGFNRLAQILLALTLFISLNYLAATHFERFDLTSDSRYSLTPETRGYLRELQEPVTVYGLFSRNEVALERAYDEMEGLLREYAYVSRAEGGSQVRYELVDFYTEQARVRDLFQQHGIESLASAGNFQARPAALVVGPHGHRLLRVGDIYNMAPRPNSRELVPSSFKGEEAITLALIDVSGTKRYRVYFINNHQESQLRSTGATGLSVLRDYLERGFYEVEELDLLTTPAIPSDADMVILAGPQTNLREYEVQKLRRYLNQENGRLMVFMGPWRSLDTERADGPLRALMREWGLRVDDMVVADFEEAAVFNDRETVVSEFAPHPATQFMAEHSLRTHSGFFRPVRRVDGEAMDSRVTVTTLMRSSRNAYAELSYRQVSPRPENFDEGVDVRGPVSLAALSERNAGTLRIPGGRLMVFGNPGLIENFYFNVNAGNQILVNKSFAWMLDREEALNLEPREPAVFNLSVTPEEIHSVVLRMLALPATGALLGLGVFALRRR